ncbi:MAG: hypothetical protein ACJ77X_11400 [Chloroflexota bacterium]
MSGFPPGIHLPDPMTAALLLGLLTGVFALRVAGQAIVARWSPAWLPPMSEWYSGVLPYPQLLATQVVMLVVMAVTVVGLALGWPIITDPRPALGTLLLAIAWPYGLSMPVRYGVRMWRHPEARWTGRTIPIVFHVVLAAWLFVLGSYLRPLG